MYKILNIISIILLFMMTVVALIMNQLEIALLGLVLVKMTGRDIKR
jgi:hypothetical protein